MGDHYASDYSPIMGFIDLIPVILFAVAGSFIIRELFSKLKKPFAVMLCSGVTLSLTAGLFKAIWKILLSFNVCDFYPFDVMFMPTQSLGFILMGAMKPLSTKLQMDETTANWVEQGINIVAQGTLLGGVLLLKRAGFLRYKEQN